MPAMTTGPAEMPSTSEGCAARSPHAASRRRSRSVGAGSWSGPTPGSTTSAGCAAAPTAAVTAWTPTWRWPPPSSRSVPCYEPPGTATAGTPGQDHHASADLLADAPSPPVGEELQPLAGRGHLGGGDGGHPHPLPPRGGRQQLPHRADDAAVAGVLG